MTCTLILIPTESERDVLGPLLEPALRADDRLELCGFGLVAAAALTAQLIANLRPERVILVGIAGTLCDDLPVGSATVFDEVACYGIGAGSGAAHQSAGDMGWHYVGGRVSDTNIGGTVISDTISLQGCRSADAMVRSSQLLSVTAASGDSNDAAIRRRRFPDAVAEDMEGFAVAMACRLAGVPVTVVRGISNQVGDRNVANWQVKPALEAATALVRNIVVGQAVPDEGSFE
jgi:futalosine hydrolase